MNIVGVHLEPEGVGWHRCWNWTTDMKRRGHSVKHKPHAKVQYELSDVDELLKGADVVITSKMANAEVFAALLAGRDLYKYKLVVDTDDDADSLEEMTPAFRDFHSSAGITRLIRAQYRAADLVTVSTAHLAEKIRKYNAHLTIVPNCVDLDMHTSALGRQKEARHANDVRIYWGGGGGHYPDLLMVKDAVTRVFNEDSRVKLVFSNFVPDWAADLSPRRVFMIPFAKLNAYAKVLKWICADVAIAPMLDTEFNRSKSNVKWLDYSMAGIPGVYSDVLPYASVRNGVTGLKATDTQSWYEALMRLIAETKLRKDIVAASQAEIHARWTIKTWGARYETMLQELIGRRAIPRITALSEDSVAEAVNA